MVNYVNSIMMYRQSPIFFITNQKYFLVTKCKHGNFSSLSECYHYIKQVFFFSTSREPSVNKLTILTLARPTQHQSVLDHLAVLHIKIRLCMCSLNLANCYFTMLRKKQPSKHLILTTKKNCNKKSRKKQFFPPK